jgi:ferrous iron transport protein A
MRICGKTNYFDQRRFFCFCAVAERQGRFPAENVAHVIKNDYHSLVRFTVREPMSADLATITAANTTARTTLALMKKGDSATVTGLSAEAGSNEHDALKLRLLELGFVPGERIRVVAESFPRRDPIAVRLGNTTFALRRHEAAMIQVERLKLDAAV